MFSSPVLLPTHISSTAHVPLLISVSCGGAVKPRGVLSAQEVSNAWGDLARWHEELDMYVPSPQHSLIGVDV